MPNALELTAVSKRYGQSRALDGVDLTAVEGQTIAVLGPNGAGKSTLLSIALGLLPPTSGTAAVFGHPPAEALRRGLVGVLLQESGLLEDVRVDELVKATAGMYAKPLPVEHTMRAARVDDLARQRIGRLSGGQRQRVRFALALVGDPRLLVLDEPTVGLDVDGRRALWQEVSARTAQGHTAVFATHYLTEADDYADRVILLARGRVVADGPVEKIKELVGDSEIHVTLDRPEADALGALPGVRQVRVEGGGAVLRTKDSDATLRALFAGFADARNVRTAGTDLESAFVSLTGGE
ncbi:ATP-binding cassette domain-containing protein [Nonomuraea sp. NPDC050790]|uniref:ABC transporter ATP-binding protein n=1 Tax=Nonomuraea sp. NPDC050790 TaxID=3364371 RepID=UPI00379BAD77